ncbi:hypothetical protein BV898_15157 [Hypsibius exemplaris]|uniref:Uncharacterized protein n=1 Tax=Hypsibius exemplaris TaxID=2072580 RepID=A0A9X6RK85_HYPEX|nr:hypothetical protein BV898_15157 [Hypsibius exemplaris]
MGTGIAKRVVSVNVLNQAESDILMNLTTVIDDAYFAVAPLLLAKPTASAEKATQPIPLNTMISDQERPQNDSPAASHVDEAS